ncbi:MFS transporter [Corynebacterium sp. HS2168-gen11]|uniref:MFS transporter n=1 Tax=Corynebacterium sp. HS2168-gen11 TaxID=2974027 RepID=UPI00216B0A98|nr:MFS transporter [Corynebacterium sp. HS2168-gen11]MCS4536243.1 MFS transporter [Corynebacterium sp. HS2168-gen11]
MARSQSFFSQAPELFPLALATAAAFGALALMLPVIPLAVIAEGGSKTLAGATTTVFMVATVLTQLITTKLILRFGYRSVMIASSALLGLPTLGYLITMTPAPLLGIAAIRGCGFGALCVAQFALIAQLSPPGQLGRASGIIGFFTGASQMIAVPIGLWLVDITGSYTLVFILGTAISLLAAGLAYFLPSPPLEQEQWEDDNAASSYEPAPLPPSDEGIFANVTSRIYRRPRTRGLAVTIVPAIAISSVSMGFGAVQSFLPAALRDVDPVQGASIAGILLAIGGGAQMIFRYFSGALADRRNRPGGMMLPGLCAAMVGFAGIVVVLSYQLNLWWLVVPAFLFGAGFGAVANEALLEMFMRVSRGKIGHASTIWNASFDAGTGVGAIALGIVAAASGYNMAFSVAAGLVLIGLVAEISDRVRNPDHR